MNRPRCLIFDLETMGGLKAHMTEVESFGYKWLGDKGRAKVISVLDYPQSRSLNDDSLLLQWISDIFNEADACIAHYGEKFDRRFLNTRLEAHGMAPLKPMKLIDTWRISKDNFALHSNSLNTLLQFFEAPVQKLDLTYKEWRGVQLGDRKCLKKLNEHCRNDVDGLEYVFSKHLVHYTNKLPNWNLFVDSKKPVCPYCGDDGLVKRGFSYNQTTSWQQYQCHGCRRWPRGPKPEAKLIKGVR